MSNEEWVKFRIEYAKEKAIETLVDDEEYLGVSDLCDAINRAYGASGNVIPNLLFNNGARNG